MTQTLLIATHNPGKMREFAQILPGLAAQLCFPVDLGLDLEVEETGDSYAANAILKARAYATASGMIALGDDSGLEVDALNGAPGIRSARYRPGSDTDRLSALLAHLRDVPAVERSARFRCVIAICTPTGETYTAEGVCEGVIATEPAGGGGFGYDPVFYMPDLEMTMAQVPPELKNQISHRARAAQAALPILQRLFGDSRPRA